MFIFTLPILFYNLSTGKEEERSALVPGLLFLFSEIGLVLLTTLA